MSYLSIISLPEAKTHLRVDGTASDAEITRMISSALSYLDKATNHIAFARNQDYFFTDGCVNVYDGPINTDFTPLDATIKKRALYSIITANNADESINLNVGYTDPNNYPSELREVALEMIDYWFYKNDGRANIELLPPSVMAVINRNARYVL